MPFPRPYSAANKNINKAEIAVILILSWYTFPAQGK